MTTKCDHCGTDLLEPRSVEDNYLILEQRSTPVKGAVFDVFIIPPLPEYRRYNFCGLGCLSGWTSLVMEEKYKTDKEKGYIFTKEGLRQLKNVFLDMYADTGGDGYYMCKSDQDEFDKKFEDWLKELEKKNEK